MSDVASGAGFRPWIIRDRAPTHTPERRWPKRKWYDEIPVAAWRALRPAALPIGLGDRLFARRVRRAAKGLDKLDPDELRLRAARLRPRLLTEGFSGSATVEAFALAREASARAFGFTLHDVQLIGARHILLGRLVEMATGEGKTATTVLAAITAALAGLRVHVVTVNEYLRERDHETLAPVYESLGLTSATVGPDDEQADKDEAYRASIVHVTNKTLVFDYLRARVNRSDVETRSRHAAARLSDPRPAPPLIPPDLSFAIVDEADSVLIDEAQTPLIIAAPDESRAAEDCQTALDIARTLKPGRDFNVLPAKRRVDLTDTGRRAIAEKVAGHDGIWAIPRAREELLGHAISADHVYIRDQHYVVMDDKVQIVDEFTGRVLADRQWQAGLHQMIEVKEGIETTAARKTLAQITFQQFFRRYLWFGGMTGTALEVAREIRQVYGPATVRVPTHSRPRRRRLPARMFGSEAAKWTAIARRAARMAKAGRPVLVGTRSVEASERLAAILERDGLPHRVLNARQDGEEADIIAKAGEAGVVTIATNMAGRGTDIKLTPDSRRAGGLHVMLTEFHESGRIDRQLYGRAGRQGDPGSQEAFVSLQDDIFRRYAPGLTRLARTLTAGFPGRVPSLFVTPLKLAAQNRASGIARRNRVSVLKRSEKLASMLAFARRDV